MARYEFKLPDIGEGIAEAEIVAWHVKVGDQVGEDQQLADMMTDKATVEMESPVAGKVLEVAGEVGDMIPIGSVLVVIETEGAAAAAAPAAAPEEPLADGMTEIPEALDPVVPHEDVSADDRRGTGERRSGEDRRADDRGEADRRQGDWRAPRAGAAQGQPDPGGAVGFNPQPDPPRVQASPAVRQRARDLG